MVLMGDPRFVAHLPFDAGTATTNGLFPRPQYQSCEPYAAKMRSFCDANDVFCASGNSTLVHLQYLQKYEDTALSFIDEKLKQPLGGSGGGDGGDGSPMDLGGAAGLSPRSVLMLAAMAVVCGLLPAFATGL
jgi:acetylxylan esterase